MSANYTVRIPNELAETQVIGRVTKDVEVRNTDNGREVANVTLAVSRRYNAAQQGQQDDWRETTAFIEFAVWGQAALRCNDIKKGDIAMAIFSLADLAARPYTTQAGENRAALNVSRATVKVIAKRDGTEVSEDVPAAVAPAEDDLPF